MRFPNWSDYFMSRPDNEKGNRNTAIYSSAWAPTKSHAAKLSLLINDPNSVILAGDSGQGIIILHSFKNLGGTILAPADKFVCLIGSNQTAPIVIVNEIALASTCDIVTPSAEDILACTTVEELLVLTAPLVEDNEECS